MKSINVLFILISTVLINTSLFAQEREFFNKQNDIDKRPSNIGTNTFKTYNQDILENDKFRFRKAIRKAKQVNLILEYISDNERILMSRMDYLKMLKRILNQSDSTEEFIKRMQELFPSQNNQFLKNLNLELLYSKGRRFTLNGYLDEFYYPY